MNHLVHLSFHLPLVLIAASLLKSPHFHDGFCASIWLNSFQDSRCGARAPQSDYLPRVPNNSVRGSFRMDWIAPHITHDKFPFRE